MFCYLQPVIVVVKHTNCHLSNTALLPPIKYDAMQLVTTSDPVGYRIALGMATDGAGQLSCKANGAFVFFNAVKCL